MRRSAIRAASLAIAAGAVLSVHGCSEKLEGGAACPILCPGQDVELRDTLVAAVALDTTLGSYPAIGEEPQLLLTARGDTLETRIIVRYDTLPTMYTPRSAPTTTVPIEVVEGARLAIRLEFPARDEAQTVTVEAYDVDTAVADPATDTVAATMLPLFRPDRFLGSLTFKPSDLTIEQSGQQPDSTARIPIDPAYLLAKIQAKARLRVGLLVRGAESAELVFQSANVLRPPILVMRVSIEEPDTVRTGPYSATPAERFVAGQLGDFVIVAQKRPADATPVLAIGGVPGRRAYLRFDLPPGIVDSTSVVRATLLLTQHPNRLAARATDSLSLYPQPVTASGRLTDLREAATFLTPIFSDPYRQLFRMDSLRTAPADSGEIEIEVVGAIGVWRQAQPEELSRALVLRLPTEGVGVDELYFYSTEAAEALRPRLRIVYVPRLGIGLP